MAFNKIKFFTFLFAILTFCSLNIATAQTNSYKLLEPLPQIEDSDSAQGEAPTIYSGKTVPLLQNIKMQDFIQYAFNLLIALASVAAVFMMVYGGFLYVTSDSWQKKNEGWKYFRDAIYGILMILVSYIILKTVNPKLVEIPRSIPTIQPKSEAGAPLDFFDRISSEANTYRRLTQEAITARNEAKNNEDRLRVEQQDLQGQLEKAQAEKDETLVKQLTEKIALKQNEINQNRSEFLTQEVLKTINANLVAVTANANQNLLSKSDKFWAPEEIDTIRNKDLETISGITQDIAKRTIKYATELGNYKNSKTPEYSQKMITSADDALLKMTEVYVQTYKQTKPEGVVPIQNSIPSITSYAKSFKLSDPIKNQQKNQLLTNLCKEEMVRSNNSNLQHVCTINQ